MSTFAMTACIVLSIAIILLSATALIIQAWRMGGLKRDLRIARRNMKKIFLRIRSDIHLATKG